MKSFLKIGLLSLGGLVLLAGTLVGVFYFGSRWLGFKYDVENPIYGPKKRWAFESQLFAEDTLVRSDTIFLTVYDERLLLAQNKIIWSYAQGDSLISMELTGIVETKDRLWIHPPRFKRNPFDHVRFTEYAPFPEIRFPLSIGDNWADELTLLTYETEESGPSVHTTYNVRDLVTEDGDSVYTIHSTGTSGLGTYEHAYRFSLSRGFLEMHYSIPSGEELHIRLIAMTPHDEPAPI